MTTFHIGAYGTLLKPCRPTYIHDHHTPLVDRDTYDMAQEIRELRKRKGQPIQYPYSKLITCPVCGRPLQRICLDRVGSPAVWHCPPTDENGKPLGITDCCGAYVHETDIDAALRKAYSELDFEDIRPEVWYVLPPSPDVVK